LPSPIRALTRSYTSRASKRSGSPIIPVSCSSMRSTARCVFPVLVGPRRAVRGCSALTPKAYSFVTARARGLPSPGLMATSSGPMNGFDVVSGLLLLGLVAGQVWLTVRVWRSQSYERSQKILQSKLIWLLPVVGAVLVFSLMPEEDDFARPKKELRG